MLNKNSKILLTIVDRGEVGSPLSYKATKEVVSRIKTSPFETQRHDTKGIPTGMYLTPKGHYLATDNFVPRSLQNCTRFVNINGDAVMHFISNECPVGVKKFQWIGMKEAEKIKFHLNQIAEGNAFTYEIIE